FTEQETAEYKQLISDEIADLGSNFFYYDRKQDEELTIDTLYACIEQGILTKENLRKQLIKSFEKAWGEFCD
ncbi:MAG: hypothetical protein KJO64_07945, partial [Bacteroidia bacterium]|nr:hypothetical protein [Bacteroidia bacterium]